MSAPSWHGSSPTACPGGDLALGGGTRAGCARRGDGAARRRGPQTSWCCCAREGTSSVYERALTLRGVRTLAATGAFWEHQQVADMLAYLRALANPLDELALYGVLASPLVGLSSDALAVLAATARRAGRGSGTQRAAAPPRLSEADAAALGRFCRSLGSERDGAPMRTLSDLIERAVQAAATGRTSWRWRAASGGWRTSTSFCVSQGASKPLRAAISEGSLTMWPSAELRGSGEAEAPVDGADPDAVRLMSIHAAKGLEFPVVCLADLGRAPNNSTPDLLIDGDRVGLRLALLDGERAGPRSISRSCAPSGPRGKPRRRTASCTSR